MRKFSLRSLLMVVLCVSSSAASAFPVETSADLLVACGQVEPFLAQETKNIADHRKALSCINFLHGFQSGHLVGVIVNEGKGASAFCQPEGTNLGHMPYLIIKFLRENPQYSQESAGVGAWKALEDAWPCS